MLKSTILVMCVVMAAVLLAGCALPNLVTTGGSGTVVTQEKAFADFDSLDVSQGFNVNVSQGDAFSVVIRISENQLERLRVIKEGNTLEIGLEPGGFFDTGNVTLEADVTMPELTGIDLSGGSHVTLNNLRSAAALDAKLSGGSHLNGEIEAGDVSFDLSGGSHATLSGTADNLKLDAGGGSHAKLGDFAVVDASVNASGGSHATVNPSGRLDAVSRGGSHVRYVGDPTLGTMNVDNSSTLKQQ